MADLIRSEKPLAVSPIKTGQPLGAILASRVQPRTLLLAVSLVLIVTSAYSIWKAWPII